ncbi:WD-40 repeat-containing protein [Kalymmatonema gypsitolerans NIES-4073]|nr:WD-40 repeat-containing protein [Scytonema sp. NIES-4073]
MQETRKQRRSRNALIAGLVGALSLSGFAFWQWQQAEKTQLAQSEAIGRYSDALFNQNRDFDALIESLRIGVALHKRKANIPIVQAALRQAVYRVREHNRLEGHTDGVWSVAFSPDGKTIASGSYEDTVRLWNLNGQPLQTLKGHTDGVTSVAFSPDGKTIASGSYEDTVRLWNLNGQLLQTLKTKGATSIAFSPDGKTIATASSLPRELCRVAHLTDKLLKNQEIAWQRSTLWI